MAIAPYYPAGVNELRSILPELKDIILYYDPDIDGAVTGELLRRFLTAYQIPYRTHINENRQHGIKVTDEKLKEWGSGTIFLVDAGVTLDEMKRLTSKGFNIINIDHHSITHRELVFFRDPITNCVALMINNQYPFEPEEHRYLSGAGVMYYVLNALHPNFCGKDEQALVGLSLLSDIRPIESDPAREFLYVAFTHESPQMEYLIAKTKNEVSFSFGEQKFDRNFIDYTFSPKINALFRLNLGHHAISLFNGTFQLTREDLNYFRMVQNAMKDCILEKAVGQEFSHFTYAYVSNDEIMPYDYEMTNFIGYACSAKSNMVSTPTSGGTTFMAVVDKVIENGVEKSVVKRGSVRSKFDLNYLALFRKHGFIAEGHENAFGVLHVDISKVDLEQLNRDIMEMEASYFNNRYEGRLLKVNNLEFFLSSPNKKIATLNNYLRDSRRFYIEYTGDWRNVTITTRGKAIDYMIDGVKVSCFEKDLHPKDALILPILENNRYISLFLKRR